MKKTIDELVADPKIKGFAKWKTADDRLRKIEGDFNRVVVHRMSDGRFIPVAILNDNTMYLALALINVGCYVTN